MSEATHVGSGKVRELYALDDERLLLVLALLSRWGLVHLEDVVHPYLLWTLCALAGSIVLAELSWRLVERPFMALGRRRKAPAAQPAPARQA